MKADIISHSRFISQFEVNIFYDKLLHQTSNECELRDINTTAITLVLLLENSSFIWNVER